MSKGYFIHVHELKVCSSKQEKLCSSIYPLGKLIHKKWKRKKGRNSLVKWIGKRKSFWISLKGLENGFN